MVPDASARALTGFVKRTVARGALILTDGWQAYAALPELGYRPSGGSLPRKSSVTLYPLRH